MKNNEEFRDSVFQKAQEFEKKRKEKRGKCVRRIIALAICAVFAVPVLYVPLGALVGNIATAETTDTLSETGVGVPTEESTAVTSSATTSSTNKPIASPSSSNSKIDTEFFYNGAYSVLRYDDAEYEQKILYSNTEKTKKYFSEEFFEENALITLNFYTQDHEKPYLADMNITEDGVVEIFLLTVEGKAPDFCSWDMFIPVSRDDLPSGEITFNVTYKYEKEFER